VSWVELEDKLRANERIKKEKELYIEADKDLPYAVVVTAMAAAQQAGVSKLQMRTDPTANLDYGQLDKASRGGVEGVEGGVVAPEEDSGKTE